MKKSSLFIGALILCISVLSCTKEERDREKIVEITIYPETGSRRVLNSDIWTEVLVFTDSDEALSKQMLIDIITEGFDYDYERGYEYKYKAKKVWMKNPPQDVSSIKYVFIELLSKKKLITENGNRNMYLVISPELIKFTPSYPNEYESDGSVRVYNAFVALNFVNKNERMCLRNIEGFDFEEGYQYLLNVEKITQAQPYSVKYVLQGVESKVKLPGGWLWDFHI